MKKALMSAEGYIHQIVNAGEEFDIYNGPDATIQWVDAPDDVTEDWTLEYSPSNKQMVWIKRERPFQDPEVARKVAYGDVGEQLDMLYKDLLDGGNRFTEHITNVKNAIPKPEARPEALTLDEIRVMAETEEPSTDKPVGLSTQDLPCWKRYPGWHGFQNQEV